MSDIQKDPIQAAQAPMPQKDNTAGKVIAIVVVVLFGFPIILAIAGMIFVSANWDKVTDWLDSHIEDDTRSSYSTSVRYSIRDIYDAANGKDLKITHSDCTNVKTALDDKTGSASSFLKELCASDEIMVAGKIDERGNSLYFAGNDACLALKFSDGFRYLRSYSYTSPNTRCGDIDMTSIKLYDSNDDWKTESDDFNELESSKEIIQES